MDTPSLESHVDPKAHPLRRAWILQQLRRLDPRRRLMVSLLPDKGVFGHPGNRVWTFGHSDSRTFAEYSSLAKAVEATFRTEVNWLQLTGALPSSPLHRAFRHHPEQLPALVGLDKQLDVLIADRLSKSR